MPNAYRNLSVLYMYTTSSRHRKLEEIKTLIPSETVLREFFPVSPSVLRIYIINSTCNLIRFWPRQRKFSNEDLFDVSGARQSSSNGSVPAGAFPFPRWKLGSSLPRASFEAAIIPLFPSPLASHFSRLQQREQGRKKKRGARKRRGRRKKEICPLSPRYNETGGGGGRERWKTLFFFSFLFPPLREGVVSISDGEDCVAPKKNGLECCPPRFPTGSGVSLLPPV